MKVLVTGIYGFIRAHISEIFHKEGHDVFIIDNLSKGKLTNDCPTENYIKRTNNKNKERKIKFKANYKRISPYLETFLLFIVIQLMDKFLMKDSVFRIFDFKLLYIVICSITYGTKQSIISILLTGSLLMFDYFSIGGDPRSLMIDTNFIIKISTYMLVGIIIGYTIDKKDRSIEITKVRKESIEEKYKYLQDIYNDTYKIKTELQNQILNSENSFGKVYGIISKLNLIESEYVFKAAVEVLEDILKVDKISIYTIDKTRKVMTLVINSNKKCFNPQKNIFVDSYEELKTKLLQGDIFVNRNMKPNIPVIIAPLMNDKKLIGVIMLHEVEFERLTLNFENLVRIVSKLISLSIVKADMFENKITREK
jgi:UDP-glucuronate decarboxylase